MLGTVIGEATVRPLARFVFGLLNDTEAFVTLALNGTFVPELYMSLPWMRSYMTPKPPRRTVFPPPERSYANPMRGPKLAHESFTMPLGLPFTPVTPMPFR